MLGAVLYCGAVLIYPRITPSVVVGGANGNSSVFLAYKWGFRDIMIALSAALAVLIFAVAGIILICRSVRRKNALS